MYSTVPQMLFEKAMDIPTTPIQYSKDSVGKFQPVNYIDFAQLMFYFGAGLLSIGNETGNHVGLISDNRKEWFVCSMGIMAIGCCDIPRGSEATVKDLSYILKFAQCHTVIAESNYSYKKIVECRPELTDLRNIIVIDPKDIDKTLVDVPVYSYDEIIALGKNYRDDFPGKVE